MGVHWHQVALEVDVPPLFPAHQAILPVGGKAHPVVSVAGLRDQVPQVLSQHDGLNEVAAEEN